MREGGGEDKRIQLMHANNVGESICDTCGYKTRTHLLRLQSQRLACCKCVCMNVHLCMCQCISVCKTLSCMYVRAFMHLCVCDVSLGVSWGVRLRVCVCVCINVGVLCRFVITEIPLLAPRWKYHLSNWPLSRGRLIPRLVWFLFFPVSQFLLQVLSRTFTPPSPLLESADFFLTLIQGLVVFIQGLPLNSDLWNGVHNVDESVISSRTRDVDLFTSNARVFLDSPSLLRCS